MSAKPKKTKLTRRKRLLFSSCVVIGIFLFTELASLVGLWFIEGQVDFGSLHDRQDRLAEPEASETRSWEVLHPYLGFVVNPLVVNEVKYKNAESNEFGFIGGKDPLGKRSREKFIIGIVGGSVAQQFAIESTERLSRELQQSPRFRDREIEYVNLALGGYKQPQQLFTLMYFLTLGGEFDAVINIDGFNEIALHPKENKHHDVFSAYPRAWHHRVQNHPDPQSTPVREHYWSTKITRQRWAAWFSRLSYRYSPTPNFVWLCRDRYLARSAQQDQSQLMSNRIAGKRDYLKTGPLRKYENDAAMYADLVVLWKRCSSQMNNVCRVNEIEYYHFLQPNQYLEGAKPMGPEERAIAILDDSEYEKAVEFAYPLLIEAGAELKSQGIPFYDLTQLFAELNDPIYVDNCCHYNQQGSDLMAVPIARAMIDSPAAR